MNRCIILTRLTRAASWAPIKPRAYLSTGAEPLVLYEQRGEKKNIGLITLNRRKALNALCDDLMHQLTETIERAEGDQQIGALVITGSVKAFAAGADIKEMQHRTLADNMKENFLSKWDKVAHCSKPTVAAVNGYALGGGLELAMMCDIRIAGDNAKLGQPEITIGTIPGAGGTQRLTRLIGMQRAMDMCLSGEPIDAQTALAWNLVLKVVPADQTIDEAVKRAEKYASLSPLIVKLCRESVSNAWKLPIDEGLKAEKRLFHMTFATNDRKEGMTAFIEKRPPKWSNS